MAPAAGWLAGSELGRRRHGDRRVGRTAIPTSTPPATSRRSFDHRVGEHAEASTGTPPHGRGGGGAGDGRRSAGPAPLPSFWSDQYGLRIQYAGYAELSDEATIEGRPNERDFAVVYTRGGRPVGALTVDDPRAFARLRREIDTTFGTQSQWKEQR